MKGGNPTVLHNFLLTCYHLAPFLLVFFGLAGVLTLIVEAIF